MPRSPAPDGDACAGAAKARPQRRETEYGTFSSSSPNEELPKPAQKASVASQDAAKPAAEKDKRALPPLHPEAASTAWWRKLFFEFFDKKRLDSELDETQVWALPAEHTSAEAAAAFREVYAQTRHCGGHCRIKRAILLTHKWKLAACWALQLASLLCDACTPVLLYMLLAMAISGEYTQTQLYLLLGLLYVTALGEVLLHCHSHFLGIKINIKIVGALRALVFENTISQPEHFPGHAAGSYDSESGKKRMAEVAHLYAEDVLNVARMVTHMQFLWRSVLQIVFELCIMVQVIGIKFKPVAFAFLFMAVFAKFLSAAGGRLRRKLQKKVEARLNVIHECFKGIQMVKLNAWEGKMQEKIDRARKEENCERRKVNMVAALQYCVGVDSPNLASIFIFGWVALQDTSALSPARVFPALLLLRRIKTHFSNISRLFDVASKGQGSICKIDSYLNECDAKACAQHQTTENRCSQLASGPDTVVAMEHACFGQSAEEGKTLLANVSFRLRRGQLAMIQGKAGAGKSTLLNVLLGNIKCLDGNVSVAKDHRIAYCAQEPWLQTLSIRENILFGSQFDSEKYWCVVEACCLKDDLRILPEGDDTQVGPKGINLSGGQKARIALARACYADADIYLLDCPFASVDAVVQNEIFTKCVVELLRFKTVIMVTHNRELSTSSFVDHVVRLEDVTAVVESAEKGWDVGRYPSRRVDPRNSLPPWRDEDRVEVQKDKPHPCGLALWDSPALPLSFSAVPVAAKEVVSPTNTQVPVTSECVGRKVARKFKWKEEWFSFKTWKMLLKGGKCMRFHVPAKIFLFLYAFAVTAKDVFLMKWSDRVDHGDTSSMEHSANVYGVLVISSMVSGFASSVLHAHAMANSANSMFHGMTAALLRAPMTFFYSTPVGELFNRYFNDVRVLDTTFALAFMAMFRSAVTILAADGILWYFTGIAGTSVLLIVLYVIKEFMSLGFLVGLLQLSFRAEAANLNFISEALDGSATIRAFGRQQINRFRVEHGVLSDELMKGQYHTEAFNSFVLIRCDRVLGIHMLLLMFLLSMHDVSPAELGLMLYYVFTINSDVYTLSTKLLEVALCLLNVERVRKYGLIEPELESYEGNPLTIPASWPHRGDVVFEHVSFSYANSSIDKLSDEKPLLALSDVSFSVQGGEKIGVVGRTGSGKSSLAMALFRVHPLTEGRILVDGLDASLLSLSALRTNVCVIPQSPLFYRCSVRNYLDPFNDFGDVALLNALRRCGLKGSMANLEAELSDNGENWSLGERQMLCLARAVLRPSRIVVLDESFSAVDQTNQSTLLNVLDTAFRDSTLFLITHRLDDVLQFDKILVMQEGQAVEFGPAEDLAADPSSAFFEFLETTLLTY